MADQMADNGRNESAAGRLTRPRKGKAGIITVVISGPSRSGKSRLAQALVESLLEVTLTYFLFNTYIILFTFSLTHIMRLTYIPPARVHGCTGTLVAHVHTRTCMLQQSQSKGKTGIGLERVSAHY